MNYLTRNSLQKTGFIFLALFSFLPGVDSAIALLLGVVAVNITGNPFVNHTSGLMHQLLKYSIVGMGFGVNFREALKIGEAGIELTVFSIFLTIILGLALGRLFRTENKTSLMISSGTAICGGSAIAAISPVIKAYPKQVSVALGVVFLLNCVALFVFPVIGHYFGLSQQQFGLWAAIAIHDTSSVVGAAANYGSEALRVATTIKLCRALWIIPVSLIFAFRFSGDIKKITIPYFIFGYVLAMISSTYVSQIHQLSTGITGFAKSGFSLSLFLVGTGLSKSALKQVGIKPLLQGLFTWIVISAIALIYCINLG